MKVKKIVSFCSLFSLVLILSVYYVLSPLSIDTETVNSNLENESPVVINTIDGETAYFENLDALKENAYLEEVSKLESIVASATSSSQEKIAALQAKNLKIKMNAKEKELAKSIKDSGYDNAYVEYEDDKINILVSKKDHNKSDALTILKVIAKQIDSKYTPYLSFKS